MVIVLQKQLVPIQQVTCNPSQRRGLSEGAIDIPGVSHQMIDMIKSEIVDRYAYICAHVYYFVLTLNFLQIIGSTVG